MNPALATVLSNPAIWRGGDCAPEPAATASGYPELDAVLPGRGWPQGALSKAYAVYPRPFWRDAGHSGQALSDEGPVFITFDVSPGDDGPGGRARPAAHAGEQHGDRQRRQGLRGGLRLQRRPDAPEEFQGVEPCCALISRTFRRGGFGNARQSARSSLCWMA